MVSGVIKKRHGMKERTSNVMWRLMPIQMSDKGEGSTREKRLRECTCRKKVDVFGAACACVG